MVDNQSDLSTWKLYSKRGSCILCFRRRRSISDHYYTYSFTQFQQKHYLCGFTTHSTHLFITQIASCQEGGYFLFLASKVR